MISNRLLRLAFQGVSALAVVLSAAAPALAGDGMPDPVVLPAKLTMPQAVAIFREHGIDLLIADAAILSARADERAARGDREPHAHPRDREELWRCMRLRPGLRVLEHLIPSRPRRQRRDHRHPLRQTLSPRESRAARRRSRSPGSAGRTAYARNAGEAAVRASGAREGLVRARQRGRADQQSDALARPDSFQSRRRL